MPTKIETENQLLRLLGNTPLQVDISLMQMATHVSRHVSPTHLAAFYKTFAELQKERFDGMIITGAPVENMPFEQVDYWEELCAVMDWSRTNVYSTMHICWGAQAGLYHHFGIPKYQLAQKLSGVFRHKLLEPTHPLVRGFDDEFFAPHSRNTEVHREDIEKHPELVVLSSSNAAGVHLVAKKDGRQFFVTGHLEYDRDTIAKEYFRDVKKGLNPAVPQNYFPNDDVTQRPQFNWRSHGHLLFSNWLNYYVFQAPPYALYGTSF